MIVALLDGSLVRAAIDLPIIVIDHMWRSRWWIALERDRRVNLQSIEVRLFVLVVHKGLHATAIRCKYAALAQNQVDEAFASGLVGIGQLNRRAGGEQCAHGRCERSHECRRSAVARCSSFANCRRRSVCVVDTDQHGSVAVHSGLHRFARPRPACADHTRNSRCTRAQ
jgi:hypothetical protein